MKNLAAAMAVMSSALLPLGGAAAEQRLGFMSGGRRIALESFGTPSAAKKPAVLILHGADGLTYGDRYRLAARMLSASGYRVFLVHYFDRTGDTRARYGEIRTNFPAWSDTIRDALGYVAAQPGIDPDRIGVIGFSLGGALALDTASRDHRVKAVVDFFGFVPETLEAGRSLPPVLVLHGERDGIVPVAQSRELERMLKRRGTPHEVVVYPGQGHGFSGEAQLDSASRVATFLGRTL